MVKLLLLYFVIIYCQCYCYSSTVILDVIAVYISCYGYFNTYLQLLLLHFDVVIVVCLLLLWL